MLRFTLTQEQKKSLYQKIQYLKLKKYVNPWDEKLDNYEQIVHIAKKIENERIKYFLTCDKKLLTI